MFILLDKVSLDYVDASPICSMTSPEKKSEKG